ncbi:MAG: hypothetical protein O3A39_10275, partial [Proteobacteria bacterium]|nr:hypothetical protein [Pseudomonadota bacterium]
MKEKYQKLTLVSKKTKRVASSHDWLLALGTHAYLLNDKKGIASLLPLVKAQKTIKYNFLTLKKKRLGKDQTNRNLARQEARLIVPLLDDIYRSNLRSYQKFLKKNFCLWIKREINKPSTKAHSLAKNDGMS